MHFAIPVEGDLPVAHPSVGGLIRQQQDRIIRAWESSVRSLPGTEIPGPILRDEMPEIVRAIALLVDEKPPGPPLPATQLAERHAVQRLGIGFELAHVLMEYSVLRNCILEVTAGERTLAYQELIALNHAIDTVANRSVEHFTEASERLLKSLDYISAEALQSKSLDDLLHRLLRVLMEASPAVDSVAILLKQDGQLRVRAAAGLIAERDPSFTIAVGEGFSGRIAALREPLLSHSAATDPRVKSEFIKLRKIQALYGVPLIDTDVVGVAHMGSLSVHDFTHEEKLLFQAMATRATAAIVHTQLVEQLEAAHNLLVSTLRQMPIGVIIRDPSGGLIVANQAAERIMRGPVSPTWPADSEQAARAWAAFDRRGNEVTGKDWPLARAVAGTELHDLLTFRWKDGTAREIEFAAVPIRDRNDQVVAGVVILEDVTEVKQAERERDLYISTMSHDLRSPLSTIQMAAASMSRYRPPTDGREVVAIERIVRNANLMERLIQQMLDFARSRHAGGLPLARRPTDLVALCRETIDSFAASDPSRQVRLTVPEAVVGDWDPDRLRQLVQNLVANALQHGRREELIDVSLRVDGGAAELRVSNAIETPIPASLVPHLFDPFRRGGEPGGLGLGLYICQQIARAHGSDVQFEHDDRRATFIVRLPRGG
jgi:signal transduction histidine kinase